MGNLISVSGDRKGFPHKILITYIGGPFVTEGTSGTEFSLPHLSFTHSLGLLRKTHPGQGGGARPAPRCIPVFPNAKLTTYRLCVTLGSYFTSLCFSFPNCTIRITVPSGSEDYIDVSVWACTHMDGV